MKKVSKLLLTSVLTIAICVSLIAGATFALFTDSADVNIVVSSGRVDVEAVVGEFKTYTDMGEGREYGEWLDGGNAVLGDKNKITLTNIVPGEGVEFTITITNNSTVSVLWQLEVTFSGDGKELMDNLVAKLEGAPDLTDTGVSFQSNWQLLAVSDKDVTEISVSIELPWEVKVGQDQECGVLIAVNAVQGNANVEQPKSADGKIHLSSENGLMAFRDDVNSGNTYQGKTVVLDGDIALTEAWTPIGTKEHPFMGTFDGQGHTITIATINSADQVLGAISTGDPDLKATGLFGYISSAAIRKLMVSGEISLTEVPSKGIALAGVCLEAYDNSKFVEVWSDVDISVSSTSSPTEDNIAVSGLGFMGNNISFTDCLNTGNITLPDSGVMIVTGFIMASTGIADVSFTNCINAGTITCEYESLLMKGGICGYIRNNDPFRNCYSIGCDYCSLVMDVTVTGAKNVSANELKEETFTGLGDAWEFDSELGHPVLKLK